MKGSGAAGRRAVGIVGAQAQKHVAESLARFGAGLPLGAREGGALALGQAPFQGGALFGECQQALAPVIRSRPLSDEPVVHQPAQYPTEALFGDAQEAEQIADADRRVPADEIAHPVVRPAQPLLGQKRVGLDVEVAIGAKQQLHALAQLLVAQKQWVYTG